MLVSFLVSLPRRRRVLLVLPLYPLVFLLCFYNLDTLTSITSSKPLVTPATTTIITAYYKLRSKHSHEEVVQKSLTCAAKSDTCIHMLVPGLDGPTSADDGLASDLHRGVAGAHPEDHLS